MSDWGHESEDLFRAVRKQLSPSASDRARVRARLALQVAAAAGTTASIVGTTSPASAAPSGAMGAGAGAKAASIPLLAKVLARLVVAGIVGTVALAPRAAKGPVSRSTAVAAASPRATGIATTPAAPQAEEAPHVPSIAVGDLPSAPTPTRPSVFSGSRAASFDAAEEAKLVAQIDAALREGDAGRASRFADEHQRRFPNGLLVQEREAARVLARCAITPSASEAKAFLRDNPRSPMRARIHAACRLGDEKASSTGF